MILFTLIRKILVPLVPLVLFYLFRKISRKQHLPKKKSHSPDFDPSAEFMASKSKIVEGEIVEEKL